MSKKLTGKALANFEAKRNVWQEVLDGVREIKAGGGKRTSVDAKSYVVQVRLKSGLSLTEFAAVLGVSKRTLEQWEQGRRKPSGAAKQLLKIAERHPEVLVKRLEHYGSHELHKTLHLQINRFYKMLKIAVFDP